MPPITDPNLLSQLEANQKPVGKELASLLNAKQQAEFTQSRQQSAIQEPAFQKLAGATIPTIAAGASMLPGVGPILGAGIQAGGTALNQAAGFEPYSLGEIAKSAAIPLAAHAGVEAVKGAARGIGAALGPAITREGGVEAAAQKMGMQPTSEARVFAPKASKAAYQAASQQGDVPLQGVNNVITSSWDKLTNMANAPTRATKYLENLSNKYAGKEATTYQDLTDELQLMKSNADKAFGMKDAPTGRALMDARAKILDEMDKVSPALKQANSIYRREQSSQEIINALRTGNPGIKIRKVFETDPLIAGAFSKAETKDIYDIADKLASIGTQGSPYSGVTAKLFNVMADTLGGLLSDKQGRFLMRQTFKDGVTPQALAVLGQFGRAYLANKPQGGD